MIYVVVCLLKIMGLVVARYVLFGFVLPECILILGRGGVLAIFLCFDFS